jgi:CBS domain-containing protein
MRAGALMTSDPRTCEPEDDLHCAVRFMKIENCGIVPVTKGNGETRVVGVVTDRDIALHLGTTDDRASTVQVQDVMSTSLAFCAPDTDVHEVSRRMKDAQVRRLLVLEGRRLVGVISTADLARATGYGLGIGEEVKQIVVEVSRPTAW